MMARQSDRRIDMSKFNVGDKVSLLSTSQWVNQSPLEFDSSNPLNVEGFIDEVNGYEYSIMWGNGQHNYCYTDDDLILAEDKQPEQDCPYNIIEELSAQVENLEELVAEQAARIRELEASKGEQSGLVFKPVSTYTLEDWQQAINNKWLFSCRGGHTVTIRSIDQDEDCRPILCSAGCYHNINGMWNEAHGQDEDDIIERVR